MPRITDRQFIANCILDLFVEQLCFETEFFTASLLVEEDDLDSTDFDDDIILQDPPSNATLEILAQVYQHRYLNTRTPIPKTDELLHFTLRVYKFQFPDIFRSYLRVWPHTFDLLVERIKEHPVFHNNSRNPQIAVEIQVAILLYRLGHYGNAASMQKVGLWAGYGSGTIHLCTRRVLTAVCSRQFRRSIVTWPDAESKEKAKKWVEDRSCSAWRNGWCMVDGTLVPLHARPAFFGNSWYDRKSNYSLNVQLISTPDLRIIDYGVGLPGSQHDSTAWQETRIPQEHAALLGEDEWVWADTAYPVRSWCQPPYKKPERDIPENKKYNYYVSQVRVRSEHCVGFLKGRWSALRGLRLRIDTREDIQVACIWVIACIVLHTFAMQDEALDVTEDEFFRDGIELMQNEARLDLGEHEDERNDESAIQRGKLRRELLKRALLEVVT